MTIQLPASVQYIIDSLRESGFDAYIVGGCVRDALMGAEPEDWDVCTDALPEQTKSVFAGRRIIETGIKYGTLTLMMGNEPFEITTHRIDGVYTDVRRPDNVVFTENLREDLARRDFTVNAMAYSPDIGIADFFGGAEDIQGKIIRCVGDADARLKEDALRIMRALRFASTLGFEISAGTAESIRKNKTLLFDIARERIDIEMGKLLAGRCAESILRHYSDVLRDFIPAVGLDRKQVRRWLARIGEERLRQVLEMQKADSKVSALVDEIVRYEMRFSLKDLAVNGDDLIAAGITDGVTIGKTLQHLLDAVIDGRAENDKTALLEWVRDA